MSVVDAPRASVRRRENPEGVRVTVERRRSDGTVIDDVILAPEIFGIVPHVAVLHQVVTAQLAAARAGTQSTRTRAEVRGGGAKPFRQKGTGRARQGSIRSPQWVGGGVALGPKPRTYRQRTPKKMIRLALYSALSDRAAEGKVALVDEWAWAVPKTRDAVAALAALGLDGRVLVVLDPHDGIADRSFANLPDVQTLQSAELNAYDILRSDWVVFTDATVPGETTPAPAARSASAPTKPTRTARSTNDDPGPAPADTPGTGTESDTAAESVATAESDATADDGGDAGSDQ